MNTNYSYLQDHLAIDEIRKHQWIQSEKKGAEIGFATAAIEWIEQYGNQWKVSRLNLKSSENLWAEKRKYRRFAKRLAIQIVTDSGKASSFTNDFNILGFACTIPYPTERNTKVRVTINFATAKGPSLFAFESKIVQVKQKSDNAGLGSDVFIPFTQNVSDFLRSNSETVLTAAH